MVSVEKSIPGKVVWTQMTHACTFLSNFLSALFKVTVLVTSSSCGHSMSTSSSIGVPKESKSQNISETLFLSFLEIGVTNGVVQCQLPESAQSSSSADDAEAKNP